VLLAQALPGVIEFLPAFVDGAAATLGFPEAIQYAA